MADKKLKTKEVDIEKMLTPDMAKAMDMLAYAFLKKRGYETDRCEQRDRKGAAARARLKKQLEADGLELTMHLPYHENKIFGYFTLEKGGKKIATSSSIEFVCQVIDINKGDGQPSE